MQAMIGESVQDLVTPGSCVDTYYAGVSNTEKQCFPSKVNNKFYQSLTSLNSGGSSTVLFNPQAGVTDIFLELTLPTDVSGANIALNRGWGYRAIKQLSYRYGSGPQYFVGSQQHALSVLESCEDSGKRDYLWALGGQALQGSDFSNPDLLKAYVYLKLPHNTPSGHKALPYPSDLTTQPLQITIDLEDWTNLFVNGSVGAGVTTTRAFAKGIVNFVQVELNNSEDYLARREDMTEKMYIYPLNRYEQRQQLIPLSASGASQSVQLVGFRSGELTHIQLFAVSNTDISSGNWLNTVPLQNVVLTVNGDVRYDSRDGISELVDICNRHTSASWANTVTDPTTLVQNPSTGYWLTIPLGQNRSTLGNQYELTHGYNIMNSVLQLQVQVPALEGGYTLFASYFYNSCLALTNGQVDFVF